ncbi:MAG: hypothetical protein HXX15_12935 [Rhodopseudomonas sp.]|uniref:hypothetical protein n=1 Tax=Rhodopseudomonas sp. TaxID=1078 RepID=UPI001793AB6B|nr:hypothetical protein [Rhodopseudomonas sp.]NVN86978.1 hypothetical protein [Rhodopseudomonas sp.]
MNWSAYFHTTSVWLFRIAIAAGVAGVVYIYLTKPSDGPAPAAMQATTPAGSETGEFPPCQPIGHTASGKLVYSMDCQNLPALPQVAGERAPNAADAARK